MGKLIKAVIFLLVVAVIILSTTTTFLFRQLSTISQQIDKVYVDSIVKDEDKDRELAVDSDLVNPPGVADFSCNNECRKVISEEVDKAVSELDLKSAESNQVAVVTKTGISYVSMGNDYSTTQTDWVDVPGSGIYLDLISDYGDGAKVSWEASLKPSHQNGKIFARIYDDTNKIAVDYSEITSTDSSDYAVVSSSYLPFWRGRNLYKVQIKSLDSTQVNYSNGRLKISY